MKLDAVGRLERLGRNGINVSVACGPCGIEPFRWTVTAMRTSPTVQEFDRPFAANSFEHAVEIAEIECYKRGWLNVGWRNEVK